MSFLLTVLLFFNAVRDWWPSLQGYEIYTKPRGVTDEYFLPKVVVKALPFFTAAVVTLVCWLQRHRQDVWRSVAPSPALALLLVSFGFRAIGWEYRGVALTWVIPALVFWLE